jgi:predicted DNA-binding transcriptional regulator AlpA
MVKTRMNTVEGSLAESKTAKNTVSADVIAIAYLTGGIFMTHREELMRKIQAQQRFLDELLLDIANFRDPAPMPPEARQLPDQAERLMRAKDVQAYLGIKPATFYEWIKRGALPPGENFGGSTRSRRWRFSEIRANLAGQKSETA